MELGAWIPQIFYDLIGRVLPGAFLLLLSGVLFVDYSGARSLVLFVFKDAGIPLTVVLIVGAIIAYVVGALLGAIGFAFSSREWIRNRARTSIRLELPAVDSPHVGLSFMYDSILLREPPTGARLAKLQAERHMCRVLMMGTIMLGVAYAARNWFPWGWLRSSVLLGLALLAWSAYLFDVHLEVRSGRLLVNLWHLLGEPARKQTNNEST